MAETPDETLKGLLSSGSQLPPSELNVRLTLLWPLLHGPQRNQDATALVALFRHAGYVSDGLPFPNGDLTVYRGELVSSRKPGISWTTSRRPSKRSTVFGPGLRTGLRHPGSTSTEVPPGHHTVSDAAPASPAFFPR